jgi:hypothetical protein
MRGNHVVVPPGEYKVSAPAGQAALVISANNVNLTGSGGPPYSCRLLITGPGSGILIEATGYPGMGRGSQLRNLALYANMDSTGGVDRRALDGIVVHSAGILISDCFIANMKRHGILIESGTVGSTPQGVLGATATPNGTVLGSNWWRLFNVEIDETGDSTSKGDESKGAGLYFHGSDTNGGVGIAVVCEGCNVGIYDGSLGGATWVGCYGEDDQVGYKNAAAGASTYVGCWSEDFVPTQFVGSPAAIAVGGALASPQVGAPQRVGQGGSVLNFSNKGMDGSTYAVSVPGNTTYNSAIDLARDASSWSFVFQPNSVVYYPYQQSWRWSHRQNGFQDLDIYGGPFGWTDTGNSRGAGLPIIGNPLMNSARHWSWKTTVTLAAGANTVYLFGGSYDAGSVNFLAPATSIWPNAISRITIDLEFANVGSLNGADVRVVGYAFVPEADGGRNAAAKLVNNGGSAVTVTVVWHFETYVANSDSSPA